MSELRTDTITGSDGTSPVTLTKQSAYKAYIAMNMVTDAVGESLNNSSNVDNASNNRTFNFTNNFSTATYYTSSSNYYTFSGASRNFSAGPTTHSTGSCSFQREDSNGSGSDETDNHGAGIGNIGDLA
jgi:hypothetical protein